MKSILIFYFLSFGFIGSCFGQFNGYFQKHNFFSINGRVNTPPFIVEAFKVRDDFFPIKRYDNYRTKGERFSPAKNAVNYGFNMQLGRSITRRFAIGIKYDLFFIKFPLNTEKMVSTGPYVITKCNYFQSRSTMIIPFLEFSNREGFSPIGLSHQFGIALGKTTFVDKDYAVQYREKGNYTLLKEQPYPVYDFKLPPLKFWSLIYNINIRIPVNKWLLFNVGVRYNLNIYRHVSSKSYDGSSNFLIQNNRFYSIIRERQTFNVLNFESGFTYCF